MNTVPFHIGLLMRGGRLLMHDDTLPQASTTA
jgi:hypothetical protein